MNEGSCSSTVESTVVKENEATNNELKFAAKISQHKKKHKSYHTEFSRR